MGGSDALQGVCFDVGLLSLTSSDLKRQKFFQFTHVGVKGSVTCDDKFGFGVKFAAVRLIGNSFLLPLSLLVTAFI